MKIHYYYSLVAFIFVNLRAKNKSLFIIFKYAQSMQVKMTDDKKLVIGRWQKKSVKIKVGSLELYLVILMFTLTYTYANQ